jgi:hypothetical protein
MASYEKQFVFPPSRAKRGPDTVSVLEMSFRAAISRKNVVIQLRMSLSGSRAIDASSRLSALKASAHNF